MARYTDEEHEAARECARAAARAYYGNNNDAPDIPPPEAPAPELTNEDLARRALAEPLEDKLTQWRARVAERETQWEIERVRRELTETRARESTAARAMSELETRLRSEFTAMINEQRNFVIEQRNDVLKVIGEAYGELRGDTAQQTIVDGLAKIETTVDTALTKMQRAISDLSFGSREPIDLPNPISRRVQ